MSEVARFPVEKFARSRPPENEPASITYDVAADPAGTATAAARGAFQNSVTDEPDTELVKLIGAPGGVSGGGGGGPGGGVGVGVGVGGGGGGDGPAVGAT